MKPTAANLVAQAALTEAKLIERVLRQVCGDMETAREYAATGFVEMRRVDGAFETELVIGGNVAAVFKREFHGASIVFRFVPK